MNFIDYLQHMVDQQASDLYLTTGAPASIKINGILTPINEVKLKPGVIKQIAYQLMDAEQRRKFENTQEMNLALSEKNIGRFRVNIFQQRSEVAIVVRNIKTDIPSPEELSLPDILKDIVLEKRGLILFVGATGAGKSTSLASLIDYRAKTTKGHIITIEDPIEFTHRHSLSIVNQREVGMDTLNYENALANTLRQAPDVILIGEIRTSQTMQHAVAFAETGHLCLSTLHANNANQALDRIINFFPKDMHKQILLDLSLNLRAIVSQRLIPTLDNSRVAAFEILQNTPLIADLIQRGEISQLKDVMTRTNMITFDGSLYQLHKDNVISYNEALRNADSQNNLRLKISLEKGLPNTDELSLVLEQPDQDDSRGLDYHHGRYIPNEQFEKDD